MIVLKTKRELELMREACRISANALCVAGEAIKPGVTTFEVDQIVNTFQNKESVDDFSVAVTYDEIKENGYSLSAGQYFDIKIDYVDITEEEFNQRMANYKQTLTEQFAESHRLEEEIMTQFEALKFNE